MVVEERVHYMSGHSEYGLWLRAPNREFIDGLWHFSPGIHVQFHDGRYSTTNKEIIRLMDGLLNGDRANKWRNWFIRVPSQKEIEEVSRVARKEVEEKKKALDSMPEEKKAKFKAFDDFMKKQKGNVAVETAVKGMRSIGS